MPGSRPLPHIRLRGDRLKAAEYVPKAKQLLMKVAGVSAASDTPIFNMSEELPNGVSMTAGVSGTTSFVEIFHPFDRIDLAPPDIEFPDTPPVDFADYTSGAVRGGYIIEEEDPDDPRIMSRIMSKIYHTEASARENRVPAVVGLTSPRLAVAPGRGEPEYGPEGKPIFSQYHYVAGSQYSGAMRGVIQALLGFGNQIFEDRDGLLVGKGFKIAYDYSHYRTHGVTTISGEPWLVEISQASGVRAMRLPVFNPRGFAADGSQLSDVYEELGFLPSGEGFPSGDALTDAIEAGSVLQLLEAEDLADVYSGKSSFCSEWGWAFNERGNEAYITAYDTDDDGHMWSYLYRLDISIVEPDRAGNVPTGTAKLLEVMRGYIWCPHKPSPHVQYLPCKVPDGMGGVVNIPGAPATESPQKHTCDAPIYVSFIDGDLHVVKFYRTKNDPPTKDRSFDGRAGERVLLDGSWDWEKWSGIVGVPPMMYTSKYDDREELPGTVVSGTLTSTDMGFDRPRGGNFIPEVMYGYVQRDRRFRQETTELTQSNPTLVGYVGIPSGDRQAYVYAYVRGDSDDRLSESMSYDLVQDPTMYFAARCLGYFDRNPTGFDPMVCGMNCKTTMGPGVRYHPDFKVIGERSDPPGERSSFANDGPWLSQCDSVDDYIAPKGDGQKFPEPWSKVSTPERSTVSKGFVVHSGGVEVLGTLAPRAIAAWREISPDPNGGGEVTQFMYGLTNCLGPYGGWISHDPWSGGNPILGNAFLEQVQNKPTTLVGYIR